MAEAATRLPPSLQVVRWSTERPLLALVWIAAAALWAMLAVSLIGIVYAALLAAFVFLGHVLFITHLRGNAVRLGPAQMPDLYERVAELAKQIGLKRVPEAYVVQAGGALNALATKFLRANLLVLYSDLLEACGNNRDARDFIIAHELGHLHAGHLRWRWLLLPGLVVPFLGTAYSRACEYTCDRYGIGASRDPGSALEGLCILAVGGKHGREINRRALVAQRADLNTAWMKIGHWLSTHPPIAHRLAALEPALADGTLRGAPAAIGALALLALAVVTPAALGLGVWRGVWPRIQAELGRRQPALAPAATDARAEVESGILSLVAVVEEHRARFGRLPASSLELYSAWAAQRPGEPAPLDPHDGMQYGYRAEADEFVIWSVGPDSRDDADNLVYSSRAASSR